MALRLSQILPPAVLLVLAIVGILLVVLPAREMKKTPENMYGIVLDAGSSRTTLFIYKWPSDKQNDTGIVTQHDQCQADDKGISSYAGQPGKAAKSLEVCMQQALIKIPKSRQAQTPLYFGATAGMRLLEPAESQRMLKEVEAKLRSYPFSFKAATVLSGQEEGAYGWVTVNYLLENFVKYGFVGKWLNSGKETAGALDLGGASTQITFETNEEVEDKNKAMEMKLYGKTYKLYTQSYLCFGQNEFLGKLLAHLIQTQGVKSHVFNPCYPRQFNTTITLGVDVFNSECTKDYQPAKFDPHMNVTVVGKGDEDNCLAIVKRMFSFDKCTYSKCSFDGVFQPTVKGSFMAFSAFYYTYNYLTQLTNIPIRSVNQMSEAVRRVCNMSMTEMVEKTKREERRLKRVCAVSNFIKVLLMEGYKFDEVSFPTISFQREAGGASVGWALGYMLSMSNMVPAESLGLMKAMPSGHWAGILTLFILLLFFALGYMLLIYRSARTKQDLV